MSNTVTTNTATCMTQAAAQAAGEILSPGQRTSGQEHKENAQHGCASTQNEPGGGHKEAKTEPQDENANLDDVFNPPVKNKPMEPTASPEC